MSGTIGRPKKDQIKQDSREAILRTAIAIIKQQGTSGITVRNICSEASVSTGTFYHYFKDKDDLLMHFVSDSIFSAHELKTPLDDPAGRIVELYRRLIDQYTALGLDFMKSFYTTDNTALSAYLGQTDGKFPSGSIMERSEQELSAAQEAGLLSEAIDVHQAASDICTIVKGSVFEWCLSSCQIDLPETLDRIIRSYLHME